MRREGQNERIVLRLIEIRCLRSSRSPSPPAVAEESDGAGGEQREGGGFRRDRNRALTVKRRRIPVQPGRQRRKVESNETASR